MEQKRKAVVKDWWMLVVWFIRLRKAAHRQETPNKLLEVELKIQKERLFNGKTRARDAKLTDYPANYGTDGEESSDVEDPMK